MKYLSILLIFSVGALNAQTTFKSLKNFDAKNLAFNGESFITQDFQPLTIELPDQATLNQENLQSDVKLFTPQQYNLTNYPLDDLSDMDDLLMGTSLSNSLQLGRQSIQTTYFFDISGNLKSSETSFTFSKKKKKKR